MNNEVDVEIDFCLILGRRRACQQVGYANTVEAQHDLSLHLPGITARSTVATLIFNKAIIGSEHMYVYGLCSARRSIDIRNY